MRKSRAAYGAAAALALASGIALADPPRPTASAASTHAPRPTPSAYHSYVSKWHACDDTARAPLDEHGRSRLVLVSLNTGDRMELDAATDLGGFAASDLDRASFVLREPSSGNQHPVEPRLVDLAYRIQTHFDAPEVRVISGYRTPRARRGPLCGLHCGRGERIPSNHGRGRAMDIVVPGVSDADVATFARELGYVGVGIYPTSGFVHVDVRDRSYFWVDASAPGHRDRERPILGALTAKCDAAAAARGERRVPSAEITPDVDAALHDREPVTPTTPTPTTPDDGDDDDDAVAPGPHG
jgi:uncharacterized protein YcbK (DUF882 family)